MIMKILHIVFSLNNGGKENMLIDIAVEQEKLGHDIGIIVVNNIFEISIVKRIPECISLYLLNRSSTCTNFPALIKLFSIINIKFKPDIIHAHDASLGRVLALISTNKRVLTVHGLQIPVKFMKYYTHIYSISTAVQTDLLQRGGLESTIIYNGIYTKGLKAKMSYSISDSIKIVCVGRLSHDRKGQDLAIRSVKYLNSITTKKIELHLIGSGSSLHLLQGLVTTLGIDHLVFFHGNINRETVYNELFKYDIFLLPSRFEGFGLTIAEAMAAGLPVVSSDISGPAEVLGYGQYGFLFQNDNVDDLTSTLLKVISSYETKTIQTFAKEAQSYCKENFDVSNTALNYIHHYPI